MTQTLPNNNNGQASQNVIFLGFYENVFDQGGQKWLLAEKHNLNSKELVGMSFYFPLFSSWEGKYQLLNAIFVKKSERRKGIGSSLLKEVIRVRKLLL